MNNSPIVKTQAEEMGVKFDFNGEYPRVILTDEICESCVEIGKARYDQNRANGIKDNRVDKRVYGVEEKGEAATSFFFDIDIQQMGLLYPGGHLIDFVHRSGNTLEHKQPVTRNRQLALHSSVTQDDVKNSPVDFYVLGWPTDDPNCVDIIGYVDRDRFYNEGSPKVFRVGEQWHLPFNQLSSAYELKEFLDSQPVKDPLPSKESYRKG